jgi:DNA gyrase subunit A
MGRNTQGVRLLNLEKRNDEIASVCEVLSESLNEEGESLTTEESAENTNEIQE